MRPIDQVVEGGEDERERSAEAIIEELRMPPPSPPRLHETAPAAGDAEVVLYTPEHEGSLGHLPPEQLERVWDLWCDRTAALTERRDVGYVLIFENRGEEVGVTIHHPHGQIYAFPFVPPRQRHELGLSRERAQNGNGCVTCSLVDAEAGGSRSLVATESAVAYVPFASAWPFAAHVLPRRHAGLMTDLDDEEAKSMRSLLGGVLRAGDKIFDRPLPTMMALLQRPCEGSDTEGLWHFRIEIVSPLRKAETLRYVASAEVNSGTYTNPVLPEEAASRWREALEDEVRA